MGRDDRHQRERADRHRTGVRRSANLVHIGSIGGRIAIPTYAVYGATKTAVAHLTRILRGERGRRGVRLGTVEPGPTDAGLGDGMRDESARDFREQYDSVPAQDMADAIVWSVARPGRVNVAELVVLPTTQGWTGTTRSARILVAVRRATGRGQG